MFSEIIGFEVVLVVVAVLTVVVAIVVDISLFLFSNSSFKPNIALRFCN